MESPDPPNLVLSPIGRVRTARQLKFDAPPQPDSASDETNTIELFEGHQFELALKDLEGFDKIWVVWWFDRNQDWRPTVLPPRGPAQRRGVFATRSPHRPCPIGLTCVALHSVEGRVLTVGPLDMTDGTPVLDIKPYLRTVDCHPEASLGWLESVELSELDPPPFQVLFAPLAQRQLDWLRIEWGIDLARRATEILSRDPSRHRTRRILQIGNRMRIACGSWRLFYRVEGASVTIEEVLAGYSQESLAAPREVPLPDLEAQIAFRQMAWH